MLHRSNRLSWCCLLAVLLTLLRTAHGQNTTTPSGDLSNTPNPQPTTTPSGDLSIFSSPYYNDSDSFISVRAAALGAALLSGLCGQPLTAAHVRRAITLLSICRPAKGDKLTVTEVPFSVPIGSAPLAKYYAGAAILNPVFFTLLGGFTAFCSLILAKAQGRPWKQAFVVGAFPSHLTLPFFFLLQTSVTSALTVIMEESAAVGLRVVCGLCLLFWVLLSGGVAFYLWRAIPLRAHYIKAFREISADSNKVQLELTRRIAELEASLLREETEIAQQEAAVRAKQEQDELAFHLLHGGSDAASDIGGDANTVSSSVQNNSIAMVADMGKKLLKGLATTEEHLNKMMHRLIAASDPREDDALLQHVNRVARRKQRMTAQERERVHRATNLLYSKMLSLQLSETTNHEKALETALVGKDRWEDSDPTDAALLLDKTVVGEDETEVIAATLLPAAFADFLAQRAKTSAGIKTGFVVQWQNMFTRYREKYFLFILVEVTSSLICGLIEGWRPTSGQGSSCTGPAISLVILFAAYFVCLVAMFPFISRFEGISVGIVGFLQTIAAIFVLITIASPEAVASRDWVPITSYLLAVFCIYLLVLKALSDLMAVLSPYFQPREKQWDMTLLTEQYFDASRETTHAADVAKAKANELFAEKSSMSSAMGGSPSQIQQRRADAKLLPAGSSGNNSGGTTTAAGGSTDSNGMFVFAEPTVGGVSLRMLSDPEADERSFARIGGRQNAFVVSRGVPETLHPFVMIPLVGVVPLPPRADTAARLARKALRLRDVARSLLLAAPPGGGGAAAGAPTGSNVTSGHAQAAPTATTPGGGVERSATAIAPAGSAAAAGMATPFIAAGADNGADNEILAGALHFMKGELRKEVAAAHATSMQKMSASMFSESLHRSNSLFASAGGGSGLGSSPAPSSRGEDGGSLAQRPHPASLSALHERGSAGGGSSSHAGGGGGTGSSADASGRWYRREPAPDAGCEADLEHLIHRQQVATRALTTTADVFRKVGMTQGASQHTAGAATAAAPTPDTTGRRAAPSPSLAFGPASDDDDDDDELRRRRAAESRVAVAGGPKKNATAILRNAVRLIGRRPAAGAGGFGEEGALDAASAHRPQHQAYWANEEVFDGSFTSAAASSSWQTPDGGSYSPPTRLMPPLSSTGSDTRLRGASSVSGNPRHASTAVPRPQRPPGDAAPPSLEYGRRFADFPDDDLL